MDIIRPGNLRDKTHAYTFLCRKCGCIFKAKTGEYEFELRNINDEQGWYTTRCPFCDEWVGLGEDEATQQLYKEKLEE